MSLKKSFNPAALAALIVSSVLVAQDGDLTLERALATALAQNPEVLAARTEAEAARGRTFQLKAWPEPQVLLSLEGLPLPGLKQEGDETEVSLDVEQVLEFPGKRSLRAEIGRYGESLAAVELERIELIVSVKVKKAYWKAVFARSAAQALDKSSRQLDVLLDDLQVKYGSGAAAYADILRTRAEKARLRNQILEQQKEQRAAGLELNELLARPADEPVELLTGLAYVPLGIDMNAIWEGARMSRPSFKIAAIRKDRAAAAAKLAGLSRKPDFLAGFSLPSLRPNAWGVSFGLTLPFLRPGRSRGLVIEAAAEEELARLKSVALQRRVRSALENAYSSVKAAEEQVLVFERSLLRELEDELRIQLEYFRYGKIEAFSLLDLHRTSVLAELEHLRAILLYNLALADLEAAGEELE